MNGVSMRQYAELVAEHDELIALYAKALEEINKLQQELAQEKQKNEAQQSINKYGNGRGG